MSYVKSMNLLQYKKDEKAKTFLSFNLGSEEYAIDIMKVQEIHRYENVFLIHNLPVYIKGFMRLRNDVIPIIDLHLLYNLKEIKYTEFTVVIILSVERKLLGIVVNETPEIINIKEIEIKLVSEFYGKIPQVYIKSIGVMEGRSIIILDAEKLFTYLNIENLGEVLLNPSKIDI